MKNEMIDHTEKQASDAIMREREEHFKELVKILEITTDDKDYDYIHEACLKGNM